MGSDADDEADEGDMREEDLALSPQPNSDGGRKIDCLEDTVGKDHWVPLPRRVRVDQFGGLRASGLRIQGATRRHPCHYNSLHQKEKVTINPEGENDNQFGGRRKESASTG